MMPRWKCPGGGGFLEGVRLLLDSQLNSECVRAMKIMRDKYVEIVVGGGDVVDFRESQSIENVQNDLYCSTLPQPFRDVGERIETVGIGIGTIAQLVSNGIFPGSGGYTVSGNGNERSYCRFDYKRSKMQLVKSLDEKDDLLIFDNELGIPESANYSKHTWQVAFRFRPTPNKRHRLITDFLLGETETRLAKCVYEICCEDYRIDIPVITSITNKSRERKVPSSRIARFANFAQLGISLASGAAVEVIKRSVNKQFAPRNEVSDKGVEATNPFVTSANADKIVQTLCRVRGAALKLGQMLSIQDPETVSPALLKIFERVRDSADFMPISQVKRQLRKNLGNDWMENFLHFEEKPFAAASIGQVSFFISQFIVHSATLKDGRKVAMKVQYPGVAEGIDADINNLVTVMKYGDFFPRGLFLKNFVDATRIELKLECDYEREARAMKIFRKLFEDDEEFYVPEVIDRFTTKQILTTEFVEGIPLDKCENEPQEVRDYIATKFVELCLKEIFLWRFMQTDPNWSNFFFGFDPVSNRPRLILLDFGASRYYSKKFVDQYMNVLRGAYKKDKTEILKRSREIGFLSGYESKLMEDAHCDSILILGETLASSTPYDFSKQNVTRRIHALLPVMLEHRIKPPPDEIYSLHRKLSGSFLLAAKLKATVSCGLLFDFISQNYQFGDEEAFNIDIDNTMEDDQIELFVKTINKQIRSI